jgi:hypothetical protein
MYGNKRMVNKSTEKNQTASVHVMSGNINVSEKWNKDYI